MQVSGCVCALSSPPLIQVLKTASQVQLWVALDRRMRSRNLGGRWPGAEGERQVGGGQVDGRWVEGEDAPPSNKVCLGKTHMSS